MRYTILLGHKIGLLLLGDPRQSGLLPHEGFSETSLKVRRAHPIAYMDFSLDQETLLGSLASSMANKELLRDITYVPDYIKMEPGTKYGTAGDFMVFKW
jgi:hypothetical protein